MQQTNAMQDKVILTIEEIQESINFYHSDKEATEQRTAIQNANPKRWIEYLDLQTQDNKIRLIETKAYLDSLVSDSFKVIEYLKMNQASQQVIDSMQKLIDYDVDVAFSIVEAAHQRAINESGATGLVISLSSFYKIHIGIRPRIEGFLNYLANTVPVVYSLNSDKLREPLARYVKDEERINLKYLAICDNVEIAPPSDSGVSLSHREISLLYYYDDLLLTDATATKIATQYGLNSGVKLMVMYRKIRDSQTERRNSRDSKACLERVIPLLKTPNGISKAKQDLENVQS
jgi:hypothetical protein